MAAKVFVKRLVQSGVRKGPSELLVLTDHALEQWYNEETVRYLEERRAAKAVPIAVIP